jgi:hypothetical protein
MASSMSSKLAWSSCSGTQSLVGSFRPRSTENSPVHMPWMSLCGRAGQNGRCADMHAGRNALLAVALKQRLLNHRELDAVCGTIAV